MEWFHIKAVQFFLDGTCEGAAAAALNFATAVASEVDESQFLAAADNNTPHHSGRKRFPHSKGRLIDADWKHRVAVALLRDRKDATGNQATKLEGVGGKVMRQVRESEMAAVLV